MNRESNISTGTQSPLPRLKRLCGLLITGIRGMLFVIGVALLAVLIRGFWQSDCVIVRASENVDALLLSHCRGSVDIAVLSTFDFAPQYGIGVHHVVRPASVASIGWPYHAWFHWIRIPETWFTHGPPIPEVPGPMVHFAFGGIVVQDVYQHHFDLPYNPVPPNPINARCDCLHG